jgi:hypothetical protein
MAICGRTRLLKARLGFATRYDDCDILSDGFREANWLDIFAAFRNSNYQNPRQDLTADLANKIV